MMMYLCIRTYVCIYVCIFVCMQQPYHSQARSQLRLSGGSGVATNGIVLCGNYNGGRTDEVGIEHGAHGVIIALHCIVALLVEGVE